MKIEEFMGIMDVLLGKNGCPWDRAQTHKSLRECMVEECGEAVEAIDSGDMEALKEELGDVLLQVVFHAKLAEKAGHFTFYDIVEALGKKIVDRHSHVFGEDKAATADEAMAIWQKNKAKSVGQ
ncbi:MAG: nucleotide pyrophosphohydrolase [Defluviitaleaceae bacterium]|nr:nucleotide pyrophosphohydrolase [Defluviitaleaceae bacterium]